MIGDEYSLEKPPYSSLTIKFGKYLLCNNFSIETEKFRIISRKTGASTDEVIDIKAKDESVNVFELFMMFYEFINIAVGYFPNIAGSKGKINGVEQYEDLHLSAKYISNAEHIDDRNQMLYIDRIDKDFVTNSFIKWQEIRRGIKKCGSLYFDAFLICQSYGYKYRDMQLVTLLQSIEGYSRRNQLSDKDEPYFRTILDSFIRKDFCLESYAFASEKSICDDSANGLFLNIETLIDRCVNERNRLSHMNFYNGKKFLDEHYRIVIYYKLILQFRLHLIADIGLINFVDTDNLKSNISNTEDWYKREGIYQELLPTN